MTIINENPWHPFLSCVVPAHNESGNIQNVVDELTKILASATEISEYEIIIVNDNSTDGTGTLIDHIGENDPHIRPVHRSGSPGFGNAVKAGIKEAKGDVIVPVMGDLSDDPRDILLMIQKIGEGYDIAYGSRFISGGKLVDYPPMKMVANRVFNNTIRFLFGLQNKDITNAFKAYRREVFEEIDVDSLESSGFDLTLEIPLKAHIAGFSSAEVPAHWYNRTEGEAKLKLSRNATVYGKRLLKLFVWGNLVSLRDLRRSVVHGSLIGTLVTLLLGLIIVSIILMLSGFSEVMDQFQTISYPYIILGIAVLILSFAIRTWRWSVLLRSTGYVLPHDILFKTIMFGYLLNYLLPARIGDIARAFPLKANYNTPLGVCYSSLIVERFFDMIALAILLTVFLLFIEVNEILWIPTAAILISIMMIAFLYFIYRYDLHFTRLLNRVSFFNTRKTDVEASILKLNDGLKKLSGNYFALLLCFALSCVIWIADIYCLYLATKALHIDLQTIPVMIAGIASSISQSLPLTPAGIGVHEFAVVGILGLFGVAASVALSIALLDHAVRAAVIYTLGIISTIHIGFLSRRFFRGK